MSSSSSTKSCSSASSTLSEGLANFGLDTVTVQCRPHTNRAERRKVVSAPANIVPTSKTKHTSRSSSASSFTDASTIVGSTEESTTSTLAKPASETEKKPRSKAKCLSAPELDWQYRNVYTTRSRHGKSTLGFGTGAPTGCRVM